MGKWKSKGCPRCGGDMFIDSDEDGRYGKCMMCAHRVELGTMAELGKNNAQSNDEVTSTRETVSEPS